MDGQVVQRQTAKDIFSLFICFCQPQWVEEVWFSSSDGGC